MSDPDAPPPVRNISSSDSAPVGSSTTAESSDAAENSDTAVAPLAGDKRARHLIARTDANNTAVKAVQAARSLLPNPPPVGGEDRTSARVARLIGQARPDHPSATRELGLAAVQIWQSLVHRRRRSHPPVPATILFTDLVAFSTWALDVGDDQVLRLLREVNTASEAVITQRGGRVVKHLGDGIMAVFVDGTEAIEAAYEAICAVSALTIDGYRPQLRAGLHTGAPRAVGDDFLGVDVNIAARVAAAAGAGELLVSAATLEIADAEKYSHRRRRFKAKGVPRDLTVYAVVPRYDD